MKRHRRANCTFPGCREGANFTYSSLAEEAAASEERQNWTCTRHSDIQKVLSFETPIKSDILTCVKQGNYHYWSSKGKLTSGFTHGDGYRAFAEDFPEGTKLIGTAQIELPKNE